MRRVGTFAIGLALLLAVSAAQAVIIKLVSLKDLVQSSTHICVAKVEKVDPDRPAMVLTVNDDIKGKLGPRRLPINLKGDSFAEKLKHTPELLKRVEKDLPVLLIVKEESARFIVFAYTEGTWFQVIGQKDKEDVRWSFAHCEPYFRRTFKGTTAELREILEKAVKEKMAPPPPDEKVEPGLGPERKTDKRQGAATVRERAAALAHARGPMPGVIVGLPAGGIIGILALLFPAVFGGMAILMRRWAAFVTVLFTTSTIFTIYLFWGSARMMWLLITATILGGMAWAWLRQLRYLAPDNQEAPMPPRTERITLLVLSGVTLGGLVLLHFLNDPTQQNLAIFLWIIGAGCWAGWLYVLLPKPAGFERRRLPTEGLMLCCMAGVAIVLTAGDPAGKIEGSKDLSGETSRGASLKRQVWKFTPPDQSDIAATPTVVGNRVYVGVIHGDVFSKFGRVYCLESYRDDSGEDKVRVIWRFDNDGKMKQMFSSPTVVDGKVYIGEGFHENNECNLFCLDAKTGKELWHFDTSSKEENDLWGFETNSHVESTPIVVNGRVYFGSGDKGLYCVDASSGKKVWQYPRPGDRRTGLHIDSNPVVVGERVYCTSGKSRTFENLQVFCVNATDGKLVWSKSTELPVWGSPAVVDGRVYVGLGNGRVNLSEPSPKGGVLCLDALDGRRLWDFDEVKDAVHTRPTVVGSLVIVGSRDGFCYALDIREGKPVWKKDLGSPTVSTPAVARGAWNDEPGALYIAATKGDVYCLDPRTGEVFWHFDELSHGGPEGKGYGAALLASVKVQVRRKKDGEGRMVDERRIYFASGVNDGANSVIYCLEDEWTGEPE